MVGSKEPIASYAASVNPPRRAKRARTGSLSAADYPGDVGSKAAHRRTHPQILPKPLVPDHSAQADDHDTDSGDEDEYDPIAAAPAPKRRGRKPGTMSRSARESLRKLNHSRIEKARRTKINETLATLSTLVNEADKAKAAAGEDIPVEVVQQGGKGKSEEKEFKLDVLVKAVTYMQELIERVKTLEGAKCSKCAGSLIQPAGPRETGVKRKRPEAGLDITDVPRPPPTPRAIPPPPADSDSPRREPNEGPRRPSIPPLTADISPRLPPIASWLPHPYIDPSCLPVLPEAALPSPSAAATGSHLPSPPSSGRFRPAVPTAAVPALSLPAPVSPRIARMSPMTFTPGAGSSMQGGAYGTQKMTNSPTVSPTWTPEDETAASLLLQMSSSPGSTSSKSPKSSSVTVSKASVPPHGDIRTAPPGAGAPQDVQAVTPGSLLGMKGRQ
ncbi:hypothetical protein CERSUDRAFT_95299 [Gelatoporia subvermispora B]|uniref:BHLH domain-containing protein n=1 Tax=Ceriporiopsis subvermispora (strain B) TaxID=914234 RepID=M2PL56_CERS8|nr:hypothetical protein CERSUDRAFT_95299 [Gelatoporia subvermispora B]